TCALPIFCPCPKQRSLIWQFCRIARERRKIVVERKNRGVRRIANAGCPFVAGAEITGRVVRHFAFGRQAFVLFRLGPCTAPRTYEDPLVGKWVEAYVGTGWVGHHQNLCK